MGRSARKKPERLGEKLRRIRRALKLSQDGMLIHLKLDEDGITRSSISGYELGEREPPLFVLMAYAHVANIYLEVLADDDLDLPDIIPSTEKSLGKKTLDTKKNKALRAEL